VGKKLCLFMLGYLGYVMKLFKYKVAQWLSVGLTVMVSPFSSNAQEVVVHRNSYANQVNELVMQTEINNQFKKLIKDQSKDASTDGAKGDRVETNKKFTGEQSFNQLRDPREQFGTWMEKEALRQKRMGLKKMHMERERVSSNGADQVRKQDDREVHSSLRSILQSPRIDDSMRERVTRKELKEQIEQRRQMLQAARERREQMSVEERRALRLQIREASRGMPPPVKR
jgi:methionine-rich copper-binding protein CopC